MKFAEIMKRINEQFDDMEDTIEGIKKDLTECQTFHESEIERHGKLVKTIHEIDKEFSDLGVE